MAAVKGNILNCSICINRYSMKLNSTNEHTPKCLLCGHTFCHGCLVSLYQDDLIECPDCKRSEKVHALGVQGLPTNYAVIQMLSLVCECCPHYGQTHCCPHCSKQCCNDCIDKHDEADYLYRSTALEAIDRANSSKVKVKDNLQLFVDDMNITITDCEQFCTEAKQVIDGELDVTQFKKLEETATEYAVKLEAVGDIITRRCARIDPDIPQMTGASADRDDKPADSVDGGTGALPLKYHTEAGLVLGTDSGDGQLQYPIDVAVVKGQFYIADRNNKQICIYDINGEYLSSYSLKYAPLGIAVTPSDDVTITLDGHKLLICDIKGANKREVGKQGKKLGEFNNPRGIDTDTDGLIYVCDRNNNRVQVFDRYGTIVKVIGDRGQGKLDYPLNVAIHPQTGDVYVNSRDMQIVKIYTHDGQYKGKITKNNIPGTDAFRPVCVSFRTDGLMCISNRDPECLHILKDSVYIQKICGGDTKLEAPRGTVFTDAGDLVVCDYYNHRVKIFSGI